MRAAWAMALFGFVAVGLMGFWRPTELARAPTVATLRFFVTPRFFALIFGEVAVCVVLLRLRRAAMGTARLLLYNPRDHFVSIRRVQWPRGDRVLAGRSLAQ